MNILDIYTQYKIPPWLARHQLEVTAVGLYVVDHWQGPKLNKRALKEATLLHDMGNIVKFTRPFMGVSEKDRTYWESVQDEIRTKYGKVAHDVTKAMVKEIGVRKDTADIIQQMGYAPNGEQLSTSWEGQIAHYADTCVTPKGIEGFEIRVADLIKRYTGVENIKPEAWSRNAAQVQENVDVELDKLAEQDFSQAIEVLKQMAVAMQ